MEVRLVMRKTKREISVRILEDYYEGSIDMWLRIESLMSEDKYASSLAETVKH